MGGYVDRRESISQAIIREVKEETGISVMVNNLFGEYSQEEYPVIHIVCMAEVNWGKLL